MNFNLSIHCLWLSLSISCIACGSTGQNESQVQEKKVASAKACIEKIISEDEKLGTLRNHACEQIPLSQTIQDYVKGLKSLDYSDCPENFTIAFEKHQKAWLDMIPLVRKYPEMRGEMHDLFDKMEQGPDAETFKPLLHEIWDTWGEIEEAMK